MQGVGEVTSKGNCMQAAILQKPGLFTLEEMDIPRPGPDELLVKTKACGICTSEIDFYLGKAPGLSYPRFIGHEPAGIVEEVGKDVQGFAVGDHVSVWSEGKSYAEYFVTKASYAYRLLPAIPFDEALGEPIACSTNGVRKADPQLNDSVCLVGCGFMSLIMLQIFRARGVGMVIAVDTRDSVLELAGKLGATHVINPNKQDPASAVKDLTGGRGVDIGVEAAGSQATLDLVGNVVRMEGKLEVFGFHQGAPRQVPWGWWNWMAFTIVNGHVRSPHIYVEGMRQGLGLLESGRLNMKPLITHRFPLHDINVGFDTAAAKSEGFVKGVIAF
jgi:L-iditol 2-dehydrogenase